MSLGYDAPVGGGWNLAHICGLLPESHALFVTPAGCARIIQLSALEAGLQGRFSVLRITEPELIAGGLEEKIDAAARTVLERFRPRALFLFTSCVADFIGLDRAAIFDRLRAQWPEIPILDGRMDPINRESGLPPIVRMQNVLTDVLRRDTPRRAVLCTGSFWPPEPGQELLEHLRRHGVEILHGYRCRSFDEYAAMGGAAVNLVLHSAAVPAARALEQRLGMPWAALDRRTDETLLQSYETVCGLLQLPPPDVRPAMEAARQAARALQGRAVDLDDTFSPDPAALVRQLQALDVPVRRAFLDGGGTLPGVQVIDSGAPEAARAYADRRWYDPGALCAGETAAYFAHSGHYCSGLRFSGRFGWDGLRRTLQELARAAQEERPLRPASRCGRGCFGL